MTLKLSDLQELYCEQKWLDFSSQVQEETWQQSQQYSNNAARWNAYLNLLSLNTLIGYLKEEAKRRNLPLEICLADLSKGNIPCSSVWEFINGTAIKLGNIRLVIIPQDRSLTDEFSVPQEWVDIPSLVADYYLALQVNLQERWVRIWGYTTHRQLKEEGEYNSLDRTYFLPGEDLMEDFELLWVVQELCASQTSEVIELPQLSEIQKENLIQRLGKPSPYSPRLDIPFAQWGSLIEDDGNRIKLYQHRIGEMRKEHGQLSQGNMIKDSARLSQEKMINPPVILSQWFSNIFEESWQTIEEVLTFELAARNRKTESVLDSEIETKEKAVTALIEMLKNEQLRDESKPNFFRVAGLLGDLAYGNADAISVLTDIIHNHQDEEIRRESAVGLRKIDPDNPYGAVRRAKKIDLGISLKEHQLVLIVTLMPDANHKTQVHFSLSNMNQLTYLPANLKFTIFDEKGDVFKELQSRENDNIIQFGFRCTEGDRFSVKLKLRDTSVTEDFVF